MSTRTSLIGRTVAASTRYPWIVLLLSAGLTLAALVFLNGAADRSNAVEIRTVVIHKRVMRNRWLSYRVIVPSWRPGRQEEKLAVLSACERGRSLSYFLRLL